MSFNGTLISFGDYSINKGTFLNNISAQSYKAVKNVQDTDSYRNANGVLVRNSLEHIPITVEFDTLPITNKEWQKLITNIKKNYIIELERKVSVTAYVPEDDDYITQEMYMVQPEPVIDYIEEDTIYYLPIHIKLIGY